MLRRLRLTLATLCFTVITLLFLDFTGTLHGWFGWMAKIQFLPALLALNVGVVIALVLLTLMFGRIYCSIICPLGVFQDIVARVGRRRKKLPYTYSPALGWLRYGVLILFVIALVAGLGAIVSLLAPYSSYGRIAGNLLAPLWQWGNNALAFLAERADSYAFYRVDVWMKSIATLAVAVATLILLVVLAWRNGRTYCNTICPVGTILGFLARFSIFRITIDADKCKKCTLCARNCKAACIDAKESKVDHSRCVTCGNCLTKCNRGAISYKPIFRKNTPVDATPTDRRTFLTLTATLATTALATAQEKGDGGLASITPKQAPKRQTPLAPAGAKSLANLKSRCTACQLCISVCPNKVLRPSTKLDTFMQPVMSYEHGYCRPECTKCSEVCPTGAIAKVTKEEKSSIQIGHAVWRRRNCVVRTDKVECGNCARHCPTGAIQMIPADAGDPKSLKFPAINTELCIGCGACENLCPTSPVSAIWVEGHERHRII